MRPTYRLTDRPRHNKLHLALVPRAAMQSKQPSDGDSLENHCHRVFPVLALKRQRPSQHLKLHVTAAQRSRHNTPSLNSGFIQFNSNKSASTLVHQITAWCCPLLSSVANQLHVAATVNWWDREMDGHHTHCYCWKQAVSRTGEPNLCESVDGDADAKAPSI